MTAPLVFRVLGICVPFVRFAKFEDKAYRHWKCQIADAAREEMQRCGWKTTASPVRVDVEFVLIRRPTKKARKPSAADKWPISGKAVGDLDNYWKSALDAMTNAGVYKDDKQACAGQPWKRWQRPDEDFAGAIVTVELLA